MFDEVQARAHLSAPLLCNGEYFDCVCLIAAAPGRLSELNFTAQKATFNVYKRLLQLMVDTKSGVSIVTRLYHDTTLVKGSSSATSGPPGSGSAAGPDPMMVSTSTCTSVL